MALGYRSASIFYLGTCPRIESLLRKSHFGPFFCSFSLNMSNYSPQMTNKMDSKWLPLATASILGQAPSDVGKLSCWLQSHTPYHATHDNAVRWCILDFVKLPLAHVVRTDPTQDRLAQHLKD